MQNLRPYLITSLAIGALDNLAFVLHLGLLSDEGQLCMLVAAVAWIGVFFFAVLALHWRALWLLAGLPLILRPFALAIIGGGMI